VPNRSTASCGTSSCPYSRGGVELVHAAEIARQGVAVEREEVLTTKRRSSGVSPAAGRRATSGTDRPARPPSEDV